MDIIEQQLQELQAPISGPSPEERGRAYRAPLSAHILGLATRTYRRVGAVRRLQSLLLNDVWRGLASVDVREAVDARQVTNGERLS